MGLRDACKASLGKNLSFVVKGHAWVGRPLIAREAKSRGQGLYLRPLVEFASA